jgi:hypothetical protein
VKTYFGQGPWEKGRREASCPHAGAHAARGCWGHPAPTGASHLVVGGGGGVGAVFVGATRGLQAAPTQLGSCGFGALARDGPPPCCSRTSTQPSEI